MVNGGFASRCLSLWTSFAKLCQAPGRRIGRDNGMVVKGANRHLIIVKIFISNTHAMLSSVKSNLPFHHPGPSQFPAPGLLSSSPRC